MESLLRHWIAGIPSKRMVATFFFFYAAWRLDHIATTGVSLIDAPDIHGTEFSITSIRVYLIFGFKIPLAASAYEVTAFSFSPSKVFFEEHGLHSAGALTFPGARSQRRYSILTWVAHHHGSLPSTCNINNSTHCTFMGPLPLAASVRFDSVCMLGTTAVFSCERDGSLCLA